MDESALRLLLPERSAQLTCTLDTNLLLLWLTFSTQPDLLTSMKRVRRFEPEDGYLLRWIVQQFRSVAVNAYTLAEVSNLANQLSGSVRHEWFVNLGQYAVSTVEQHVSVSNVGRHPLLPAYGVTDAALAQLSSDLVIITADFPLAGKLSDAGLDVVNFNHFRFRV